KNIFSILNDLKGTIGLYFANLNSGRKVCINSEAIFSAASTIKIPLVTLLLIQAEQGVVDLHTQVTVNKINRVGGAGVIKELDQRYQPTIMDLAKLTIVLSDNTATNQLIDIVGGMDKVNKFCNDIGMKNTKL